MSHVAHEACGVDVFLCFNPQSNQCSSVATIIKQRCSKREIIYQASDNIDFTINWYESIPVQILRSKIFIPIIDEQWYSSFWCSWMLLFALEHQNRYSLPLIMPVILPSYGERASEVLIAQLTKNYKATVMLSDHEPIEQSLEAFFKLIELTTHTPEWLLQGLKSKRHVDNERPLTYDELSFLNEMRHKEIVLMRDMSLQQERKLPTTKTLLHNQHVALSMPYDQLPAFLLSAMYQNYHITWFDVVTIDRQHYFTFIWNDNHLFQNRTSVMFYNLNPAQFNELTLKMNRYQFDLIHFDVYRHSNENMLRYICLYLRQDLTKSFHKLRTAVIANRWLNENNLNAINIRPHLLCGNLYYSNLLSSKRSNHNNRYYRINLTDIELLEEHTKALTDNYKLIDLKVYHLNNGDYRFIAMWTNEQEGSSTLYLGLTYDELVERLNEKQLRTAIITNYGLLVDGQQCFALVCNQYGSV
ncbi:unnamed protein product [Rotaria sp. Silwood1]|nr:unnamed protein product [Rotaria sp. Silwood1]CAF0765444.1 unnamed protein product [Rotaria sp. Silwood1]CAF3319916.1 unnamed protein product [Rotaria sp. Silwood1]CAF3345813.1 unnamed protein product [Rotaria sp. Silwood1]CAF4868932.1 unnamed protein product [Rotaria sp. Silwood1]